jgi:hypothetical protein
MNSVHSQTGSGIAFRESRMINHFDLIDSEVGDMRDAYNKLGEPFELKSSAQKHANFKLVGEPGTNGSNLIFEKLSTQFYLFSTGFDFFLEDSFRDFEIEKTWLVTPDMLKPWIEKQKDRLSTARSDGDYAMELFDTEFQALTGVSYFELQTLSTYQRQKYWKAQTTDQNADINRLRRLLKKRKTITKIAALYISLKQLKKMGAIEMQPGMDVHSLKIDYYN